MTERRTNRGARWLAWSLAALAAPLAVAGTVLIYLTRDEPVSEVYGARGMTLVIAIPFGAMGALLATRRTRNPISWLFLAAGSVLAFGVFGEGYGSYSFARHGRGLPLTDPIVWVQNWAFVPLVGLGFIYPFLLFPDGRLPSRRWRWVAYAAPVILAAFGLGVAFQAGQSSRCRTASPTRTRSIAGRSKEPGLDNPEGQLQNGYLSTEVEDGRHE